MGRFRVKAHAGKNRVRLGRRIKGRSLGPGTYVIRARTLPARRTLIETKLVIFKGTPLPGELAVARASNTCRRSDGDTPFSSALGGSAGLFGGGNDARTVQIKPRSEGSEPSRIEKSKKSRGALGVQFTLAADVKKVSPLLFVLLGIAIGLLAAAAMPLRFVPSARMAAVLAYRRTNMAMAGAITLASVAAVYAVVYALA